ncbi:MAG: RIP metalloprotease RseP [Deltaproteobacteria bacterium]|jgi:regulator of sigma E protease|nr:RIP metalloprotease RseP [Deltaproteobacteria bacterium]
MLFLWQAFIFIIVIGVLVFVHEFGHFIVAKCCGVGVLKFSLGFGKAIYKFTFKETVYQISWIPLGGYVRMVGDMPDPITTNNATDNLVRKSANPKKTAKQLAKEQKAKEVEESEMNDLARAMVKDPSCWFLNQNFSKKFAIVAAGPIFNFILAIILFGFMGAVWGIKEPESSAIVGKVQEGSPAFVAGLQEQDKIITINDRPVNKWEDAVKMIRSTAGAPARLKVERSNALLDFVITPQKKTIKDIFDKPSDFYLIGIEVAMNKKVVPFWKAPEIGVKRTYLITKLTLVGLQKMITGELSTDKLSGPIFIFKRAAEEAKQGLENILGFMAILSVSLAVLNLLPIPVLDGGHLMFFILEKLKGGELPLQFKEGTQMIGFFLLMVLMSYVIFNDIRHRNRDLDKEQQIEWNAE